MELYSKSTRLWENILSTVSWLFKYFLLPREADKSLGLPKEPLMSGDCLRTILSGRGLRRINLGLITTDLVPFVPLQSPQRLHYLQVTVENLSDACELLKRFGKEGTSELKMLNVKSRQPSVKALHKHNAFEEFFLTISHLCHPTSLVVVNLSLYYSDQLVDVDDLISSEQACTVTPSVISLLFESTNVREVNIRYHMSNLDSVDQSFRLSSVSVDLATKKKRVSLTMDWKEVDL